MSEFRLRVGERAAVRPRWWGRSWSVTYAGMFADGTYSFAVTWSAGHNSAAYNLFLGRDQREVRLPVGTLEVSEVSRAEVRFRFTRGSAV